MVEPYVYLKGNRKLLKCFEKGDVIRFSFTRDHFSYTVGNAFEEEKVVWGIDTIRETFAEVHERVDKRLVEIEVNRCE